MSRLPAALALCLMSCGKPKPPEGVFTDPERLEVLSDGLFLETRPNLLTDCMLARTSSTQPLKLEGDWYVNGPATAIQVGVRATGDSRSLEWVLGQGLGTREPKIGTRKALTRVAPEDVSLEKGLAKCDDTAQKGDVDAALEAA